MEAGKTLIAVEPCRKPVASELMTRVEENDDKKPATSVDGKVQVICESLGLDMP